MAGPLDPFPPTGLPPVIGGQQPQGFWGTLGQNLTSPGFLQNLSTMLMARAYGPHYGNFLQGANQGRMQQLEMQRIQQEEERQRIQQQQMEQYRRDQIEIQRAAQKRLEEAAKVQQESKLAADEERRIKAFQDFSRLHMNADKITQENYEATLQTMGEQYKIPQEAIDAQKAAIAAAFKQKEEETSWWVNIETGVPEKFKGKQGPGPTEGYRYRGPYTKEEAETVSTKVMSYKKSMEEKQPSEAAKKDAGILAAYARDNRLNVEDLTEAQKEDARFKREAALAAARMAGAPGQEVLLVDPEGNVVAKVHKQTGKVEKLSTPEGTFISPPSAPGQGFQERMSGYIVAMDLIKGVEPLLGGVQGPVLGRVKLFETEKLGGEGATPEQINLANQLRNLVATQAFASGGKQLTPTERAEFEAISPKMSDTVEQAFIAARNSMQYLRTKLGATYALTGARERQSIDPRVRAIAEDVLKQSRVLPGGAQTLSPEDVKKQAKKYLDSLGKK